MSTKITYSAVVPYSAAEMFALVNAIADYHLFLPYCTKSNVHSETEQVIEATLEIELSISLPFLGKKKKREAFRTRNFLFPNERMDMALVHGPLKQLSGSWRFEDLSIGGSRVNLSLAVAFENKAFALAFNALSSQVGERLVTAFVDRAKVVYGERDD